MELEEGAARIEVARRYFRAFGPATTADLAWWTGWTKRDSTAAVAALDEELVAVDVASEEGSSVAMWVLAGELAALASVDPRSARGLRLLPLWDAYFMGYEGSSTARAC